ncbi:MAG: GntR family transcriptional regulator [Burkholderiales bacterium]|nr:GntR family transcriptional regulator [Burkholderiales bacterium]
MRIVPDDLVLQRIVSRRLPPGGDTRPLAEVACDEIRLAIRDGRIPTGAHLTENDIAGWLGMSRTPVREAMRRLESEGLLFNQPFRGAVVMRLDIQDMRQLYVVRELLEPAAAGWCALNASQADIEAMRGLLEQEKRMLQNPSALIPLNRQFHNAILEGAGNQFLTKSITLVHSLLPLLGDSNFLAEPYARSAHEQHCAMLDAIARGDRAAAESVAREHVRDSLAYRLARVQGTP